MKLLLINTGAFKIAVLLKTQTFYKETSDRSHVIQKCFLGSRMEKATSTSGILKKGDT